LSAAGYSGQTIKYIYPNDAYGDLYNQAADAARGMLADAGFKLEVQTVSYLKDYIGPTGIQNAGAPPASVVYSLQTPYTEPDDYFSQMLVKGSVKNSDRVDDPALEALIRQQQGELDEDKRLQIVYQIQRMHAEQMYYPPMVNGSTFIFTREWAQNYFVADDYASGTESLAYLSVNNK
jgi:ABC-type transport system substrate-binding protein